MKKLGRNWMEKLMLALRLVQNCQPLVWRKKCTSRHYYQDTHEHYKYIACLLSINKNYFIRNINKNIITHDTEKLADVSDQCKPWYMPHVTSIIKYCINGKEDDGPAY